MSEESTTQEAGPAGLPDLEEIAVPASAPLETNADQGQIPVERVPDEEFFRTLEDPSYRFDFNLLTYERELYLLAKGLGGDESIVDKIKRYTLFTTVDQMGIVRLFPAAVPDPTKPNAWHTSLRKVIDQSMLSWVRCVSNKKHLGQGNGYRAIVAQSQMRDPKWPEKSFQELYQAAFQDRFIDTANHPVLRALRGEDI